MILSWRREKKKKTVRHVQKFAKGLARENVEREEPHNFLREEKEKKKEEKKENCDERTQIVRSELRRGMESRFRGGGRKKTLSVGRTLDREKGGFQPEKKKKSGTLIQGERGKKKREKGWQSSPGKKDLVAD